MPPLPNPLLHKPVEEREKKRKFYGIFGNSPSFRSPFDSHGTTAAKSRVRGILADVRFPMPTAFALLAVGFSDNSAFILIGRDRIKIKLRNIQHLFEFALEFF